MMNANEYISITFKFGEYWVQVMNVDRKEYDGGKKTITTERDHLNCELIKEKIEEICLWLKSHIYES